MFFGKETKMNTPIFHKLLQFQQEDRYPFHMPGHKRRLSNEISRQMFSWDITEIDGFDELHDPSGIILDSMEELREFYGTNKTWYLVNGSSSGNMAAIGAAFLPGDTILMGRNCHKSVYHAVELFGLKPVYLYPDYEDGLSMYGGIDPEKVEKLLDETGNIKGVFLTSPTYEGVVSDIKAISQICRKKGVLLLVDEAHGAHFPFSDYFPESAVRKGADLVIQSLHKTLAVPNQGALLHLCSHRVEEERVRKYQSMFQTTSPSYVLLASMEYGIAHGRKEQQLWKEYETMLEAYRAKWKNDLKNLYLVEKNDFKNCHIFDYDKGKLVISTKNGNLTGKELSKKLLFSYQLQMEMSEKSYCIAMTSYLDTKEGFQRLDDALCRIDKRMEPKEKQEIYVEPVFCEQVLIPHIAVNQKKKWIDFDRAEGQIAGDYVYLYPPGSPILVPGEKINAKVLEKIQEYLYNNMEIKGLSNHQLCILEL